MSNEKSQEQIYDAAKKVNIDRKSKEDMHKVISSGDVMDQARSHVEKSGLSLSDKAFGEVKKILQSSKKTDKSIEKLNPNNRKKPSMKDQMVSALLLMTPQLLGTAVGAAMGEDVAGYEGAIAGQKVGEGIIDRERKRAIEEQKMQENAEEEMTQAQKVRAWSNIGQYGMSKERLEFDKSRNVQLRGENLRSHLFKEKKYETPTGQQVEGLTAIDNTLDMANRMAELMDKVDTGVIDNFWQGALEYIDAAPEEYTQLKTNVISTLAAVTVATTGAQATDAERKWLAASVPSMEDNDETFEIKVKELQRKCKMLKDRNLSTIKILQGKNIPKEYEIGEATNFKFNEKGVKASKASKVEEEKDWSKASDKALDQRMKELGIILE